MKAIAIFEAKNRFSEMIAEVERGEEITITRHGAPVARLVAVTDKVTPPRGQRLRVAAAMRELRVLGSDVELGSSVEHAIANGRD